ncbi:MAG TPA: Ig-like domain-containing protein, partial [Verrucomicrobiae bacterium]|nr:Ig-like domain-containing protein [Verrucomicrobiae bacterium]
YNTGYTLTLPSGALQDGAGNILAESYSLSFTTEAPPDTTPPGMVSTDPADGAQGVSPDKVITITFTENILAGSAYDAIAVSDGVNQVNFTKSIAGNTLTLSPLTGWSYGTAYSVTIPANSIQDAAGNQLSGYQFGFSTVVPPDTTPPRILSTSPRDGETNVPLNTVVKITFSEAIQLGSTASGITFKKGTKNVNYSVTVSGNTLTIQPASTLNARSSYTVSIPAGAVQDLKGNQLAGAYSLSFSTARK